jgi:mono/diheme cytochrome c family protein
MKSNTKYFALSVALLLSVFVWGSEPYTAAADSLTEPAIQEGVSASALYSKSCAKCHGKDGRAKTFRGKMASARNIADAKWQNAVSDERIFNSIANGREKMPAFGKKYSDAQIEALVAYVRKLKK